MTLALLNEQQPAVVAVSGRLGIELGVVALLADLKRRNGGYLEALEPYEGDLEGDIDEVKERLRGRSPAVLVQTGRAGFEQMSVKRKRYRSEINLEIAVVSGNLRSPRARAQGDVASASSGSADPGLYRIMDDLHARLAGTAPQIPGAGPLEPIEEVPIATFKDFAAWKVLYRLSYVVEPAAKPAIAAESVETHLNEENGGTANPTITMETTADD